MQNVSMTMLFFEMGYFCGKILSLKLKRKSVQHQQLLKPKNMTEDPPFTFETYHEMKLLETLRNIENNAMLKQLPIEILQIISKYGNGIIQSCLICDKEALFYNTIIKYDRAELKHYGFKLLSDNVSLICNRCCIEYNCCCILCGALSENVEGFPFSLCATCCNLSSILQIPKIWTQPTALRMIYGSNSQYFNIMY